MAMKRRLMMIVGIIAMMIAMLLWCGAAGAEVQSGNYDGMDWSFDTETGVLTLGKVGETQTLIYRDSRVYSSWPWSGVRTAITSVRCDGSVILNGSVRDMFYWFSSATTIDVSLFDVSNVTSMNQMFYCCKQLGFLDLSNWNTSSCSEMINMFRDCDNLDLSCVVNLDTENVTSFNGMFYSCDSLTSLDLSGWNTSHVTDIGWMFAQNSNVTSLDLSGWGVSHVVSMDNTFQSCGKLTNLDLTDWNISVLTNAASAFASCKLLQNLDLSGWNVSHLTTASSMFSGCESLVDLDMTGWAPSTLTNISLMFYNCKKLTSLDLSGWDVSHVTSIESLFWGCSKLETLDLAGWNPSSANLALRCIFYDCGSLRSLDLSGWDVSRASSLEALFYGCGKLEDLNLTGWDISNVTRIDRIFYACTSLTSIDVSGWNTSKVTQMYQAFFNCCKLTELDLSGWDVSHVTNMWAVFSACRKLSSLNVSTWDVSSVTKMESMFGECENLVTLNVTDWDTHSVEDFERMFYGCTKLNAIDVSHFNTSAATDMHYMFYSCPELVVLDVSNWNVSNVTTMEHMFAMCRKLTQVGVSAWNVSCVSEMDSMFYGCNSLRQLDLSDWVTSGLVTMRSMFSGCNVELLDLSGFNTNLVTNMSGAYDGSYALCEVILGEQNPFVGCNSASAVLPLPKAEKDGVAYTQKWIREDKTYGPYTPGELRDNYTSAMAGKWVWEKIPTEYTITFVCTEDGYLGDMPSVTAEATEDYTLPDNAFRVFGYAFDHWTDGTRRVWEDKAVIPANTYAAGAELTFTTVFTLRDTSVVMQDGAFDFSIKADEKALFSPVPASTAYQVYEQTPFGWNLIAQTDASGVIVPDAESEALFLNKYDPLKVTVRFAGTKLMDGAAAEVDSFNFLLYEDDTLVDIASVSEGGLIEFQPITYEQAGTHHYYIREAVGNDATVSYDTHVEEITVEITSDGVGHLYADVAMDEDEILFENASKPGYLVLSKVNAVADNRTGMFVYEIQFTTDNGQPYELFSGDITYEERDEEISELPIGQVVEKPKYRLTVQHVSLSSGLTEVVRKTEVFEYQAGDVVTVKETDTSSWTSSELSYRLSNVDSDAVRSSNGTYKLLMPNQDTTVKAFYDLYRSAGVMVYWTGVDSSRPALTFDVFGNDEYATTVKVVENDPTVSSSIVRYDIPVYDRNGNAIEYTCSIDEIPDGYYLEQQTVSYGIHRFYMHAGYRVHFIWDDNDDQFGLRPETIQFNYTRANGVTSRGISWAPSWIHNIDSTNENYRDHDYEIYVIAPDHYTVVTPSEDSSLGRFEYKLVLDSTYEIDVLDVTLLSSDEFMTYKDDIPMYQEYSWWWLRSPGGYQVQGKTMQNSLPLWGRSVLANTCGVRPALICDLGAADLSVGDKVALADKTWTIISMSIDVVDDPYNGKALLLCDDYAGQTSFRSDYNDADATDYTLSDVKSWLENWADEQEILPLLEITVNEVTLLTSEEYEEYKDNIPLYQEHSWWLRSVGSFTNHAADVDITGNLSSSIVNYDNCYVRPALKCDFGTSGLQVGDKVPLADYNWTVISGNMLLCDETVGKSVFRSIATTSDSTDYEASDVKFWLENWAVAHNLVNVNTVPITNVTLLSKEEYAEYKDNIPENGQFWWLRSPGSTATHAAVVHRDNYVVNINVNMNMAVRPILECDLASIGLQIGNKIRLANRNWTVFNDNMFICDTGVGSSVFNTDQNADGANIYETSDIKIWLDNWVADNNVNAISVVSGDHELRIIRAPQTVMVTLTE